jgi:hypothetical protein
MGNRANAAPFARQEKGTLFAEGAHMEFTTHSLDRTRFSIAAGVAACFLSLTACVQARGQVREGEMATGSWHDDRPGVRRLLRPQDLPAISKSTDGVAQIVAKPAGAEPRLPDGFSAEMVSTSGLHKPRVIRVAPNGDLFVADSMFGSVHVLRLPAGRATPEKKWFLPAG